MEEGEREEGEGAKGGWEEGRAVAGARAEVLGAGGEAGVDWVGAGDLVGAGGLGACSGVATEYLEEVEGYPEGVGSWDSLEARDTPPLGHRWEGVQFAGAGAGGS